MNEESKPIDPIYLKKSARFYKIYGVLFLFSLFMTLIRRPLVSDDASYPLLDLLVSLPIFAVFVMAPMSIYYSWKSYQRRVGRSVTRFKYFLGHLVFCLLIIAFIAALIYDLSIFFS